ncbi:hypothetical protein [Eubacterium oxidoreducens]|uniref:Cell division protein FtsL n=1 Tax=Eubacterium oxidoreducens TaxID=1732 RepID=A0A1G6AFK7_EUBOX|nr:hypothetical protein [Eubacterium oxidoreducens]SDB07212.1 Cell division protein FtsL [Eubacterium oxidoreducens]
MADTKNYYYIEGNTVREILPQEAPIEREHRRRHIDRQTKRNRQRAKALSAGNVLFMTLALAAVGMVAACYLHLQADVTEVKSDVVEMQSELITMQDTNDAYEKEIEASVSLTDIKKKAIKELGMTYPSADQIVYYSVDSQDYMQQYADIP